VTQSVGSREPAVGRRPAGWRLPALLARVEDAIGSLALLVMVVLPLAEIVSRRAFSRGIPGAG
jgi:hypothetical protein